MFPSDGRPDCAGLDTPCELWFGSAGSETQRRDPDRSHEKL